LTSGLVPQLIMKLSRSCTFNDTLKKSWKIVIWISLLFVAISNAYGQTQAEQNVTHLGTSSSPAFAIEISIDNNSLNTEFYNKTGTFFLDAKVKNISDTNQEIIVWTQYGWSWISDRSEIRPGIEAKKNYPSHITLKPGLEYSRAIEMHSDPQRTGSVTFQLGFYPRAEFPISTNRDKVKREDIVWSNLAVLAR
jgi:hypothetical protein